MSKTQVKLAVDVFRTGKEIPFENRAELIALLHREGEFHYTEEVKALRSQIEVMQETLKFLLLRLSDADFKLFLESRGCRIKRIN